MSYASMRRLTTLPVRQGMEKGSMIDKPAQWSQSASFCLAMALGLLLTVGTGCNQTDSAQDAAQHFSRAQKLSADGDYKGAAQAYRDALRADPELAQAHFELGMLYEGKLADPISAIYHYRRFLELHPSGSKKQLAEDFIERAKLSLASKLPQSVVPDPGEIAKLQADKGALMQENATLKARLAELERPTSSARTAATIATPPVTETPRVSTSPAPPVVTTTTGSPTSTVNAPKTHVVQKGDTLQSLALRYYGTRSAWEKIYIANRTMLPSKDQLKIGQQLVIP